MGDRVENALQREARAARKSGVGRDGRAGLLRGSGLPLGPTSTRYPLERRNILTVLHDQAQARPEKDWLVVDGGSLGYRDAWGLTLRIADAVRTSVGVGAHVGLFLLNQIEFVPLLLGAIASGGKAIPLNAQARGQTLHYVLRHSDARLLVARDELLPRLVELDDLGEVELVVVVGDAHPPTEIHGVPTIRWEKWVGSALERPLDREFDHREPCLIQYTSGTTGRQKGVVYSHHFLYLYGALYVDSIGLGEDDVLSTPLPLFHAAALQLVALTALHCGATAHLRSRFSPARYWDEIAADGATFSIILGPMAAVIAKTCETAPAHCLRLLFCTPPPPNHQEFEQRFGAKLIWHAFGQTEIAPLPMRSEVISGAPTDTLGYAVDWMEYGVVDENDLLLGPGQTGQIVFRSLHPHSMFSEYYKDPELTVSATRNLMYHTGDLGYYDPDGLLHLTGRAQDRIRRRGENVSAVEVEALALSHPLVIEAAAYGVPSELGEEDVKLDVRVSEALTAPELHEWFGSRAPRYMVPRYIELCESFPKTPSERIEKYLLKALSLDRECVHDFEARRENGP